MAFEAMKADFKVNQFDRWDLYPLLGKPNIPPDQGLARLRRRSGLGFSGLY